ncbi:MAG: Endonuclease/exonuclease/phosphatase [Solirubrobacterales bacterium]|nr:Endonuclease/exonuclease/phosphatase [Solirubrobacterales bacterium]
MRVLTWNLFHGRSVPGAGRDLEPDVAALVAGWTWDVALLQEVPPWWGPGLARASGASARTALTARNALLPLRERLGRRFPDVMKSSGGANTILVRGQAITAHERAVLRWWPERRVVHAVRTADGAWWGNLHAQVHSEERALTDLRTAARELLGWGGADGRLVLGGDTNVRKPIAPGFVHLGGNDVDHLLARGWRRIGARKLDAGALSDHAPVLFEIAPGQSRPSRRASASSSCGTGRL